MNQYKKFLGRTDLVKNQVEREKLAEQEAASKRKRSIQQQNKQRWLKYQEQLRSELAARYFHGVQSTGGESFSNKYSVAFDGTDDRIECSSLTTYDNSDFSVSIWVKKTTSGLEYVVSNSSATAKAGFDIVINSLDVNFSRRTRTKQATTGYINIGFSYNTWHNLIGTYNDTTDDLKLYLDGVLKNTSTTSVDVNSASVDLRIGCSAVNSLSFQGGIDEVSLFNTALTDGGVSVGQPAGGQIAQVYNSGAPNDISSLSPVSWWRFEEGSGTTAADSGTGGNNGTLISDATFVEDVPS